MTLEKGDEVAWFGQLGEDSELILFSDRGWAKRIPQLDFEPQNRSGKGVRCFYFNKNGSNGRSLAGLALSDRNASCRLLIHQFRSPVTVLDKNEILLQNRQGKGMPYIMAILDDVVTDITPLGSGPAETGIQS